MTAICYHGDLHLLFSSWELLINMACSCLILSSRLYRFLAFDDITIKFVLNLYFQQKLKEEREAKRQHLDDRHKYILQTVADGLGLDASEVEDCILEGKQVINPYLCCTLYTAIFKIRPK